MPKSDLLRRERAALTNYFVVANLVTDPYHNAWMSIVSNQHSETARVLRQIIDAWSHQFLATFKKLIDIDHQIITETEE